MPLTVHRAGPEQAAGNLIMLHGRGASAMDILSLYPQLDCPHLQALAPQAPGNSWYPYSFLAALNDNQPQLDHALSQLEELLQTLAGPVALLGFSQGACLALEFAARHPRRYLAVLALTGGLIGPPGTPRNYAGSLEGTPMFLGSGDPDGHVPFSRVEESAHVLTAMGAQVELRRYPGLPHTIHPDELNFCRSLLRQIAPGKE